MTYSNYPNRKPTPPAPLSAKYRAMIDKAVARAAATSAATKAATEAAMKAAEPYLDRARIEHFCSVQPESRLNEITGLWTDNMVLNLTRGALFDALQRESNRRFASGQRAGTSARGTSELDVLREYARAELAQRAKPKR